MAAKKSVRPRGFVTGFVPVREEVRDLEDVWPEPVHIGSQAPWTPDEVEDPQVSSAAGRHTQTYAHQEQEQRSYYATVPPRQPYRPRRGDGEGEARDGGDTEHIAGERTGPATSSAKKTASPITASRVAECGWAQLGFGQRPVLFKAQAAGAAPPSTPSGVFSPTASNQHGVQLLLRGDILVKTQWRLGELLAVGVFMGTNDSSQGRTTTSSRSTLVTETDRDTHTLTHTQGAARAIGENLPEDRGKNFLVLDELSRGELVWSRGPEVLLLPPGPQSGTKNPVGHVFTNPQEKECGWRLHRGGPVVAQLASDFFRHEWTFVTARDFLEHVTNANGTAREWTANLVLSHAAFLDRLNSDRFGYHPTRPDLDITTYTKPLRDIYRNMLREVSFSDVTNEESAVANYGDDEEGDDEDDATSAGEITIGSSRPREKEGSTTFRFSRKGRLWLGGAKEVEMLQEVVLAMLCMDAELPSLFSSTGYNSAMKGLARYLMKGFADREYRWGGSSSTKCARGPSTTRPTREVGYADDVRLYRSWQRQRAVVLRRRRKLEAAEAGHQDEGRALSLQERLNRGATEAKRLRKRRSSTSSPAAMRGGATPSGGAGFSKAARSGGPPLIFPQDTSSASDDDGDGESGEKPQTENDRRQNGDGEHEGNDDESEDEEPVDEEAELLQEMLQTWPSSTSSSDSAGASSSSDSCEEENPRHRSRGSFEWEERSCASKDKHCGFNLPFWLAKLIGDVGLFFRRWLKTEYRVLGYDGDRRKLLRTCLSILTLDCFRSLADLKKDYLELRAATERLGSASRAASAIDDFAAAPSLDEERRASSPPGAEDGPGSDVELEEEVPAQILRLRANGSGPVGMGQRLGGQVLKSCGYESHDEMRLGVSCLLLDLRNLLVTAACVLDVRRDVVSPTLGVFETLGPCLYGVQDGVSSTIQDGLDAAEERKRKKYLAQNHDIREYHKKLREELLVVTQRQPTSRTNSHAPPLLRKTFSPNSSKSSELVQPQTCHTTGSTTSTYNPHHLLEEDIDASLVASMLSKRLTFYDSETQTVTRALKKVGSRLDRVPALEEAVVAKLGNEGYLAHGDTVQDHIKDALKTVARLEVGAVRS